MSGQETVTAPRGSAVYAEPRSVTDLEDCYFYHSMEIPGYGLVEGPWDLRGGVDDYLGGVDLRDKRVLEIGTASGFLCFTMEGRGAEVVAYDLSHEQSWDVVPYAQYDHASLLRTVEDTFGIGIYLNNAALSSPMADLFSAGRAR